MDDKLELSYNSGNSTNNKKKRCCICVFWDKQGIVRDYVTYYIKGLQEVAEKVIVTVNGILTEDSREKLKNLGVQVFQRENKGLDFGAWKDTIADIGYSELAKYDELIITNTTCYGPIYPLSEMFDEMEAKECDFWGITKHPNDGYCTIDGDEKSRVIEHIQSYFLVFNKNVILSDTFKNWWDNIEYYNDYNKVVGYYETKLTKYFEDAGFKSDSYIDINLHKDFTSNPTLCPDKILQNKHLPLIKRKAIILDYNILIGLSLTQHNNKILQYIKDNTNYDIDMIYNDIISTQTMSNIKSNLHLNYVLPSDYSFSEPNNNQKIALILYIYYEDLIEYCFNYAKSMPEGCDIYVVSSKESTLEECRKKDYILKNYHIEYRLKENRGRDVSAYLVTCADVFEKYDLICCMHDKKSPQTWTIYGQDFMYQCFECNLKNKDYVKNILNIFDKNKRIGMLTNPTPKFMHLARDYFWDELGTNTQIVKDLYKELNLNIPFDKHPVAPFGSMFWIRKDAIKPLFRKKWEYKDFPNEPLPDDGTISHAIERIYPSIAQEAGYMTGWIMPNNFASIYADNLAYRPTCPDKNEFAYNNLLEVLFSVKNDTDNKHAIITLADAKIRIKRNRKIKKRKSAVKYRLLEKLFSVKNAKDKKHKIITLAGVRVKIKKKIRNKPLNLSFDSEINVIVKNNQKPSVNIFMPAIIHSSLTAGPLGILYFAKYLIGKGFNVRLFTSLYEPECLKTVSELSCLLDKAEISTFDNTPKCTIKISPYDINVATQWSTVYSVQRILKYCNCKKFIYFIQDYEKIFYANSTEAALAYNTYLMDYFPIFSTDILKNFFYENDIGNINERQKEYFVFNTASSTYLPNKNEFIEKHNLISSKKKFIFYGRPSTARNCYNLGLAVIKKAIENNILSPDEWEFYSVGDKKFVYYFSKDVYIKGLPFISPEAYALSLHTYDLGLSLMMSPHPSMLPIDLALAGVPVVTNTYKNKTKESLQNISKNIYSAELSVDALVKEIQNTLKYVDNYEERYQNAIDSNYPANWSNTFDKADNIIEFINEQQCATK